ncbi:MAG: DNA polymerase III subunit alpha, partial [Rudaea sp.]
EVDRAAKLIPIGPGQTIEGSLEGIPEFRELVDTSEYMKKLVDNARLLEGVARHASTHAAGVVVTDRPVVDYVPLHRPTRNDSSGFPVTQYPMGDLEKIGLLKIDFLGLATISIMRRACDLIKERHDVEYDLKNIPVEDNEAFALLSRGDVAGVFQVEGAGMRRVLTTMRPSKFDHIVATVALFRPGPMEYIETYIRRLHGQEPVEYKHPKLKEILEETYGIIVYQEQIIRIASELAGYEPGDADDIRKAVGKKIRDKIEGHRNKFVQGAVANGVERSVAEAIYGDIEYFARYGFNKAHAADYAVLTCQTAYLKAHYPLEYMTALLSTEIGNIEKIAMLVSEARRMNIPILAPDIRYSDVGFVIDDEQKGIRFGLSAIKNVGTGAVELIVNARKAGGPFKSLDDFCQRVDLRQVNRRVLESLVKAGAFHGFGHRSQILQLIDRMMSTSQSAHTASALGQMSLFGTSLRAETFAVLPPGPEMDNRQKLEFEKELMGVYFSEHPLLRLAAEGRPYITAYSDELTEEMEKHEVTLGGIIASLRTIQTKKGDTMAFVQLEDPHGAVEVTAFPRVYNDSRELMRDDSLVLVKGKVQVREKKVTVLADSIKRHPLTDQAGGQGTVSPGRTSARVPAETARPVALDSQHGLSPSAAFSPAGAVPSASELAHGPDDDWLPPPGDYGYDDLAEPADAPAENVSAHPPAAEAEPESTDVPALVATPEARPEIEPAALGRMPEPAAAATQVKVDPPARPEAKIGKGISIPSKIAENGARQQGAIAGLNGRTSATDGAASARHQTAAFPSASGPTRTIQVRVKRSNDAQRDVERLRDLIRVLRSVQGRDRFSLVVCGSGGDVQLDFPNYVTDYEIVARELGELIEGWGETRFEA